MESDDQVIIGPKIMILRFPSPRPAGLFQRPEEGGISFWNRQSRVLSLTAAMWISLFGSNALAGQPRFARRQVDWPTFMRQHEMVFDKLPTGWRDSPYFGNAMIGSMFYQADNAIELDVFRGDVQDHRTNQYGWTAYSRPRLMIGHFLLHPVGKLVGCKWRVDIWNAEMTGTITTDKGEIRIHHFVHADDMAIVTELTPSAGEQGCSWTWHPAPAETTRPGRVRDPNPEGRREDRGDVAEWVQDLRFGGQYATAWSEESKDNTRTLLVSIANSYPESTAAATALADVERFRKLDKGGWIAAHRKWWHEFYPRSFIAIPDKSLESLYWQTMYRYGCTSRTGRCFVDTSGIWFRGTPWPYITTDWNIQSAHWAVYTANRLDQGQELVNKLYEGREALIDAVRPEEWRKDSAYLALAVAPDMIGARNGDMRYFNLVGDLPWVLNNAWSQYRYSMDDEMLRKKIYPLLRRSVNFYLHMVEKGEDGRYHLPPTYSPESGVHDDSNFDLALFKWGCLTLLKASKQLGIDDPLIPRWREMASELIDFPADENGFRYGSKETSPVSHRHLSHLLMIYPLYLVNIEQKGSGKVLEDTFTRVFENQKGPIAMIQTHLGPIAAALGDGDKALDALQRLKGDLWLNGLWGCGDNPCIESTLGMAAIVQDMLLQSWSDPAADEAGPIRIFPAMPSTWKDAEFHDLRAEGAFLVSAKRSEGRAQWVRIRSLAGQPCRVRPGLNGKLHQQAKRQHTLQEVSPGVFEIDLNKGEEILLHGDEGPTDPSDEATDE